MVAEDGEDSEDAVNSHPLLSELRDAASGEGDDADVRAHVEVCLACRVRMARIAQHGELGPAAARLAALRARLRPRSPNGRRASAWRIVAAGDSQRG